MSIRVPELNENDPFEVELYKVITSGLWNAFETSSPETPQRIVRVVLHALRSNGYTITKEGEHGTEN